MFYLPNVVRVVGLAGAVILSDIGVSALTSEVFAQVRCGGCARRHKDLNACIKCIEGSNPGQWTAAERTRECKHQWANCAETWKRERR